MGRIILVLTVVYLSTPVYGQQTNNVRDKFRFRDLFHPYAHPWLSNTSANVGLGLSAYSGELSNFDNFSRQRYHLNPHFNLGLQRRLTDYISWRLEGSYFQLYSEAAHSLLERHRFSSRNVDYYTAIVVDTQPRPYLDTRFKKWNVYFFAGIGMTHFDPRDAESDNKLAPTQKKSAVIFPVGAGIMYFKSDFISFGFEISQRFTTTDYLDGVVTPNTRPEKDSYLIYGAKVNLNIFNRFKYNKYLRRNGYKS
ncbi:hypothetical protein QQ020_17200 [Fulvivirgaceae bacterium BMA12]|uniref:DUF6089 domain-containing protein n=1 Tax=Agaribacillus aureus TaxID=3051825 RepID=A0ABT8L7T1_9BACT|nr:hypothetical protein [Fulvivirgaceae bacterium BMA12]